MSASHRGCSLICFLAVVWLDICTSFISTDRLRADDRHALHHLLHRERVLGFAHPISFRVRSGRGPSQVGVLMQTKGGKVQTETRSAESSDESSGQAAAPKKRRGRGIGKNEQVAAAVRSYKMSEMNFSSTSPLVDERSKNPPVGQPKSRKVRDKANDISARNASSPSSSSSSPQGRWKLRLIPDISEDMSTASSRMLREGLNAQRVIQKQSFQALMRKFTMLQQPRLEERGSSLLVNPGFYEKRRLENERSASMEGGMGVVPLSELKRRGLILPHINPQELHQGSNKIIKEWNTGSAVLDVKVAGDKLYSAGADQVISEWDLQDFSPSRKFEGHKDWITAMAIESSRGFLFSASDDRTVRVWDLRTGECVKVLRGHEEPLALEVVEDTLVVGCKGAVMVWDMRTWQLQHRLTNHTQVLRAMSAGLQLSKRRQLDPQILAAREASKLSGLSVGGVRAWKKHLLTSVDDGCIWVWNLRRWEVERKLLAPAQEGVWVRPLLVISSYNVEKKREEAKLVSGWADGAIRSYDMRTWRLEHTMAAHSGPILSLEAVGEKLISTGADMTVIEWNVTDWTIERVMRGHRGAVSSAAGAAGAAGLLVTCSIDGFIKVWGR